MEHDYALKQVDDKLSEIAKNKNVYAVGEVINVRDFIIEVAGMDNVMFYEKVNIANKAFGYVNAINENSVTVAVLKITASINVGDLVYSTNTLYTGLYSPSSVGRIIDLFGEDKLTSKKFNDLHDVPIERKTIPIMDRTAVKRPLLTGITGIDLMYPIGKGQRQLIVGDKRTGKTQIGLDTIVNQNGKNVLCFYVAIGKTKKEVKNIHAELAKRGALSYTTIITAFNDELPPVISLIPYFALSVAEDYMMQGYDVLVVIDDLKRHAEAYREISLISGKTPGRDAYPADIFYTHSRLLEKGCQHKCGGSITVLPIVETKGGDITDYISTNIISITDGQIVLSAKSFQKGEKPAIDYGLSVSRLGGAVQDADMKAVGSVVRRKLLSYLETRRVYELVNMDEMSPELKNQFMEGKIILDNLNQYKFSSKTPAEMMNLFASVIDNDSNYDGNNSDVQAVQNVGMQDLAVAQPEMLEIAEEPTVYSSNSTNQAQDEGVAGSQTSPQMVDAIEPVDMAKQMVVEAPAVVETIDAPSPMVVDAPVVTETVDAPSQIMTPEAPAVMRSVDASSPMMVDAPILMEPVDVSTPMVVDAPTVMESVDVPSSMVTEVPNIDSIDMNGQVVAGMPEMVNPTDLSSLMIAEVPSEELVPISDEAVQSAESYPVIDNNVRPSMAVDSVEVLPDSTSIVSETEEL